MSPAAKHKRQAKAPEQIRQRMIREAAHVKLLAQIREQIDQECAQRLGRAALAAEMLGYESLDEAMSGVPEIELRRELAEIQGQQMSSNGDSERTDQ